MVVRDELAAYTAAEYHVYGAKPIVLRMGYSEQVACWLDSLDAYLAFVIPVINGPRPRDERNSLQHRLVEAAQGAGLRWTAAQVVDPTGEMPTGESICVFDAPLALIDEWLRYFDQKTVLQASGSGNVSWRLHPDERTLEPHSFF